MRAADWGPAVHARMASVPGMGADELTHHRAMVDTGRETAITVHTPTGDLLGVVLARIDHAAAGRELVIIAAQGDPLAFGGTRAVLPALDAMAERAGCVALRAHTVRPAMARLLRQLGWRDQETVLRREVAHGQGRLQ